MFTALSILLSFVGAETVNFTFDQDRQIDSPFVSVETDRLIFTSPGDLSITLSPCECLRVDGGDLMISTDVIMDRLVMVLSHHPSVGNLPQLNLLLDGQIVARAFDLEPDWSGAVVSGPRHYFEGVAFDGVRLLAGDLLYFQLGYVRVEVLMGDTNQDLQVTGSDIVAVMQHFGNIGPRPMMGDGNDDGQVSGADLIEVQLNFGRVSRMPANLPLSPQTIPEPGGGALALVVGGAALMTPRSPR